MYVKLFVSYLLLIVKLLSIKQIRILNVFLIKSLNGFLIKI